MIALVFAMLSVPVAHAQDACPADPLKTAPGLCGCGVADSDWDADGAADSCIDPAATVDATATVGWLARIDAGTTVFSGATLGARCHVGAGATVGSGTFVGARATVGAGSSTGANSVIGRRSAVGAGSTLLGGTVIGRAAVVGDAVHVVGRAPGITVGYAAKVGNNVTIGAGSRVGNLAQIADASAATRTTMGTVRLGRASFVGADAVFGSDVKVGPDAHIGARSDLGGQVTLRRAVLLGDDVTIGTGTTVGRGADLGNHTTVGTLAVVRARVVADPWASVVGSATVPRGTHILSANQPPSTPGMVAGPARPTQASALTCSVSVPSADPEGNSVTYTYAWLKDGVLTAQVGSSVPNTATSPGEVWTCQATASDGVRNSGVGTATVRVGSQHLFSYTGAAQAFVVPAGATEVVVKAWGAAGGGGNAEGATHRGGPGGFVSGAVPVTAGETLTVRVGQGGAISDGFSYSAFPNGGVGSSRVGYLSGGGGGRSAVERAGTDLFVAGGGGGAGATGWGVGYNTLIGGGGGYPAGADGAYVALSTGYQGRGGSQAAGGALPTAAAATMAGGLHQGGNGGQYPAADPTYGAGNSGGGGGDGYYGGSAASLHGGGGGGSSYIIASATDMVRPGPAATALPPNATDADYVSPMGAGATNGPGNNGYVVIWAY